MALALSCISPADELPASPQAGQPSLFGVSTSLLLPLLSFQDPAAEQTRLFLLRFMRRGTGLLPRRQCPGGVFSTPCPPAVSGGDCVPLGRARVLADVVMVSSGPSPAVLLVGRGCRQRPWSVAPLEAALFDTHTKTHQLLSLGPLPIPLQELRPRLYQWVQTFPAGERCLVFEDPEWRLSGVGGMWGTCRGYGQSRESGLKPVVGPG